MLFCGHHHNNLDLPRNNFLNSHNAALLPAISGGIGGGGGGGTDLITHGGRGGAALITGGGDGGAALITGGRCGGADVGAGFAPPEDIPDDATKVRGGISGQTGELRYTGKIPILENILFMPLPLEAFFVKR